MAQGVHAHRLVQESYQLPGPQELDPQEIDPPLCALPFLPLSVPFASPFSLPLPFC